MNTLFSLIAAILVAGSVPAAATSFASGNLFLPIPDMDPTGVQHTLTFGGLSGSIADLNVSLCLSGGLNGDYYALLSHGGKLAVLLNRPGLSIANPYGYSAAGFGPDSAGQLFRFDDEALSDVHWYGRQDYSLNSSGQLTGSWQPDGRNADPQSSADLFPGFPRGNLLGIFDGMDPNGSWTLFLADFSPGAEGTLVNWGLEIAVVPEPSSVTVLFLAFLCWYNRSRFTTH